jgi:3-phenylpropionate/trans-cinnamate dioxygenase ferredoxin reductase subunit
VIGAGFVGMEVASTALELGADVTVVDTAPAPLLRQLGPEVGRLLAARARALGADVRLGVGVERIDRGRIELLDGSVLHADAIVAGIGAEPVNGLIGEGAVETDACGRTARPGVFACGDVAAWWRPSLRRFARVEHWTSAAGQARAVARTILGEPEPHDETPYFWSDQFGLRLQFVGHGDGWDRVELDGDEDAFVVRYLRPERAIAAALAANRPQEVGTLRRSLAA